MKAVTYQNIRVLLIDLLQSLPQKQLQDKIAINEKPKEPIKVVLPTDAIKAKVDITTRFIF